MYRFQLKSPLVPDPIHWIIDPFAREFGIGKLSAFTLGFQDHVRYFYNDWARHQSQGVLLFSREDAAHFSLVGLNFTDADVDVAFTFPRSGPCAEQLHHQSDFQAVAGQPRTLTLPSNYGRIWTV